MTNENNSQTLCDMTQKSRLGPYFSRCHEASFASLQWVVVSFNLTTSIKEETVLNLSCGQTRHGLLLSLADKWRFGFTPQELIADDSCDKLLSSLIKSHKFSPPGRSLSSPHANLWLALPKKPHWT